VPMLARRPNIGTQKSAVTGTGSAATRYTFSLVRWFALRQEHAGRQARPRECVSVASPGRYLTFTRRKLRRETLAFSFGFNVAAIFSFQSARVWWGSSAAREVTFF